MKNKTPGDDSRCHTHSHPDMRRHLSFPVKAVLIFGQAGLPAWIHRALRLPGADAPVALCRELPLTAAGPRRLLPASLLLAGGKVPAATCRMCIDLKPIIAAGYAACQPVWAKNFRGRKQQSRGERKSPRDCQSVQMVGIRPPEPSGTACPDRPACCRARRRCPEEWGRSRRSGWCRAR